MVKVQLDLPEPENRKLKHYMIDNNIDDKRLAIISIIKKYLK